MEKATIYDYARMCNYYSDRNACTKCPTFSLCGEDYPPSRDTDKINEIILKWCKEHPVKTRQDKFFGDVSKCTHLYRRSLEIKPCHIDETAECGSEDDCDICRSKYWLVEAEENE